MHPNVARPVEWIVLGSGTALPTATRGSPGHLLRMADGRGVLVDPGPGSVRAAAKQGVLLPSLRAVVLTHFHPDHCLDLFALLFGLRHASLAHCRLTVAGPVGTAALLERGRAAFGKWATIAPERLEVVELRPGLFTLELEQQRIDGEALALPHLEHSLGYRFRGHAKTIAYSGDTGTGAGGPLADAPVALGRGADVYVLEAALPEGAPTDRHLTPSTAARIAAAAGVKELVLTHFYPDTERSDGRAIAREHFLGTLVLGYDGLRLPL